MRFDSALVAAMAVLGPWGCACADCRLPGQGDTPRATRAWRKCRYRRARARPAAFRRQRLAEGRRQPARREQSRGDAARREECLALNKQRTCHCEVSLTEAIPLRTTTR